MKEELIKQIVRNILAEPAFQCLMQGNVAGCFSGDRVVKPNGLVLLNFVPDFRRVLTAVEKHYGKEYRLFILPSECASAAKPDLPEGMNLISNQSALTTDWQKIIIPACSPNTLAKIALGIRDNLMCEIIGRVVAEGKSIELVTEYLGFTAQTPESYLKLYDEYIQTVKSYGVQICAAIGEKCTSAVTKVNVTKSDQPCPTSLDEQRSTICEQGTFSRYVDTAVEVIRFEKKYLADKDAYEFPEGSRVWVKRLAVISPLARDTLKLRRIELSQEMEGGRP